MGEVRVTKGASGSVGASVGERPERRRPQVEVIHEPNEPDEDVLADPKPAE
jgi:hypothetical protein